MWSLYTSGLYIQVVFRAGLTVLPGDEVSGLSISIRERDDIIQIWNTDSSQHTNSTITEKIQKDLLPRVAFLAVFYKGDY